MRQLLRDVLKRSSTPPEAPEPTASFTTSALNESRLPPPTQKLALVFREPPAAPQPEDQLTIWFLKWLPVFAAFCFGALPIVATLKPQAFVVAAIVAGLSVRFLWPRAVTVIDPRALWAGRSFVFYVAGGALVMSYVAHDLTFGVVLAGFFLVPGSAVVADIALTYRQWLGADPKLFDRGPGAWERPLYALLVVMPFITVLGLFYFLMPPSDGFRLGDVYGGDISEAAISSHIASRYIIAPLVLGVVLLIIRVGWQYQLSVRALLQPYLFYNGRRIAAAGVWAPMFTLPARRQAFATFALAFFASVLFSLQLYSPMLNWAVGLPFPGSILTAERPLTFADAATAVQLGPIPPAATPATEAPATPFDDVVGGAITGAVDLLRITANATVYVLPAAVVSTLIIYGSLVPVLLLLGGVTRQVEERKRGWNAPTEWEWCRARIDESEEWFTDPITEAQIPERDHLFLGRNPSFGIPVLLHRPLLREHCYIVGDSGSGKTALGVMPLVLQELRTSSYRPLVIIDLKGDPALFHATRREAESLGRSFQYFRPEKGFATHRFNPIQNLDSATRSEMQLCQVLLDSLSLNHGEGYGRSYYSKRSRQLLLEAMKGTPQEPAPATLRELSLRLASTAMQGSDRTESFELLSTIQALAHYPALESGPKHSQINMADVLEHRKVVYFWLPAAVESMSVREIAKMALFSLLSAAIDRQNANQPPAEAMLVIDEFQRIAGENFKILLEQARSFGIGLVLANQSLADLKTDAGDLRATVTANTRVKIYFSVNQAEEIDALSKATGEVVEVRKAWSFAQTAEEHLQNAFNTRTDSFSEFRRPRLTPTDIRRISDHPLQCLLHVSRGSGLTQFAGLVTPVETRFPFSFTEYKKLAEMGGPNEGPPPLDLPSADDALSTAAAQTEGPLMINEIGPKEVEEQAAADLSDFWSTVRSKDRRGTDDSA